MIAWRVGAVDRENLKIRVCLVAPAIEHLNAHPRSRIRPLGLHVVRAVEGASEVHVGQGINAGNIEKIVELLKAENWSGPMSLECRGEANSLKSLEWFRGVVNG